MIWLKQWVSVTVSGAVSSQQTRRVIVGCSKMAITKEIEDFRNSVSKLILKGYTFDDVEDELQAYRIVNEKKTGVE